MTMFKYIFGTILITALLVVSGCKKQNEWLDEKYNLEDVVPKTLDNYQQLMNNPTLTSSGAISPLLAADNILMTTAQWQTHQPSERNSYIWAADIFEGNAGFDWNNPYEKVMFSNVVLEGLEKILAGPSNQMQYDNVKGQALFIRAAAFYELLQIFAKPYSPAALNEPGIAIRTSADINTPSTRATIKECYDKVLSDLQAAETLLPIYSINKFRPSKTAVQALLARIYLNMEDYDNARLYAGKALTVANSLLDFNSLNLAAFLPMPNFLQPNPEVIWHASTSTSFSLPTFIGRSSVDTNLFNSYVNDDLRKTVFYFPNTPLKFRGSYYAIATPFAGLATNELYLIRAEAAARLNDLPAAMTDLNALLEKRWRSGAFVPFTAATRAQALQLIFTEKRKELPFTASTRWEDLRRFNKDPAFALTLTRVINNQTYTLTPNSNRYVFPIPDKEIRLSGMPQNPR